MTALFHCFKSLGYKIANQDVPWEYTEEPHSARRAAILKKYPQIKRLMGPDPSMTYIVIAEVMAQLVMCYFVKDLPWSLIFVFAYIISATLNHSLGSAIHEIGHNLAFGHSKPLRNRALGMVANLPMAVPISVTYKIYHSDHHRYLGHDTMDVDIPTVIETYLFQYPLTKMLWLFLHPVIHGIRPFCKSPKTPTILEAINTLVQLTFDVIIFYIFGVKSLVYLLAGTMFGLGFHPLAGHFISEHYLFNKGQATHSYYGPLNPILFNVGYHVEHHDFPYIPARRLPKVREIASEFYDDLPYHTSWLRVIWDFIFDPNMGPKARGVGYLNEGNSESSGTGLVSAKKSNMQTVGTLKTTKEE